MLTVIVVVALLAPTVANASVASKVVGETAEFLMRQGGKKVVGESVETLVRKMSGLAARHGDDLVAAAFRRVGPRAARIASEAGEEGGGVALKWLARHGDDAVRVASRPKALQLAAKFGDDIAEPLIRHGEVGEKLIEKFGAEGAEALGKLSQKNGRRLAMLVEEQGEKVTPDLVRVFAKHGSADTVADWVWRRKGSLFVGAALATFVNNPNAYLDAAESVSSKTLDAAVKPLAEMPKAVAAEAAANTNWTMVGVCMIAVLVLAGWHWSGRIWTVARAIKGERPPENEPRPRSRDN